MALSLKEGVQLTGLRPEMVLATVVIDAVYTELGVPTVITSAVDGQHSENSLHYTGLALDFRTNTLPPDFQGKLLNLVTTRLGAEFDVVLEEDHLHVEFQPETPPSLVA